MEAAIDHHPNTYLTWSLFLMPTNDGGIRSIAVTATHGQYLNSVYVFLVTGICGSIWQFVIYLALLFYPTEEHPRILKKDREHKDGTHPDRTGPTTPQQEAEDHLLETRKRKANRYIALIAICNASSPWKAIMLLFEHSYSMVLRANDRPTAAYDTVFLVAAFLVGVGTYAAGVIIPSYIKIGTVAPANPWSVFYAIESDLAGGIKVQQTRAPAAQRAMGVVESSRMKLKERVNILPKKVMNWTGPRGEKIEQITYDYNITGLDLGLQHKNAGSFVVNVEGACTLEYGWFDVENSDENFDVYEIFDSPIYIARVEVGRPVGGSVLLSAGTVDDLTSPNRSYAIIPDTVSRTSFSKGTDPWYITIPSTIVCPLCPDFQVANRRPILSCWQNDIWSYEGNNATSILSLASIPGLDLPAVIRDEFIPSRLAAPMIHNVATSLGGAILVSSTGSRDEMFDASISNYAADFERLLLASFVSSQNILLDTTLIADTYGLNNKARINGLMPQMGAGDFVISTGDVVTLSLKVMIIIPIIALLLWFVPIIVALVGSVHRNSGARSRFTLRTVALQPMQLYRLLDEEVCGYRDDWFERRGHMPYIGKARPVHPKVAGLETTQIQTKAALGEIVPSDKEIEAVVTVTPVVTISVPKHALFAAPKVMIGPDNKHHLRFTGPVRYEPPRRSKSHEGWSWRPHGERDVVSDRPARNEPAPDKSSLDA